MLEENGGKKGEPFYNAVKSVTMVAACTVSWYTMTFDTQ